MPTSNCLFLIGVFSFAFSYYLSYEYHYITFRIECQLHFYISYSFSRLLGGNIDMTVFERIKKLANEHGKAVSKVATDLGFSENLFYRWKTSEPKARDLEKVADYFNVSVDYLLGRTDTPEPITKQDNGPGTDLMGYFRLNTAGFNPDETEQIEESLKDYTDFLVQKARERKARDKK